MVIDNIKPLISIIVPNYNNDKYLSECLDSLISQTYPNIEIICIDDGSTDSSIRILKEYKQNYKNVNLILNKKNYGVAYNRHKAILSSKGSYFTTLDSDDYYLDSRKVEKEFALLDGKGKSTIAFSGICIVDAEGKLRTKGGSINIKEGDIFENILLRNTMIPRDFMMTKEQYHEAGCFDTSVPIYEDWDLKLRLAHKNKFYFTGSNGIAYRRHGEGLSSANNKTHLKWLSYIFQKNKSLIAVGKQKHMEKMFNDYLLSTFNVSLAYNVMQKIKVFMRKVF